jgi:hypothetical protein
MGGTIKQRHHLKAMIISGLLLIVVIFFIMWLKGEAERQPVPTSAANDVRSTEWKKFGTDKDGDHYYRFDESSKTFPDILSVKTRLVYSEEGKKGYIAQRQAAKLPVQNFEHLNSRIVLYGLNCVSKNKEICVLEIVELAEDGKPLDYAKTGSYKDWSGIQPGSVYDELQRIICPEKQSEK